MKKILSFAFFLFVAGYVAGQTPYDTVNVYDPQNFFLWTTVDTANFQLIGRKNNQNGRMNPYTLKKYATPDVFATWVNTVFDSTGNSATYRDQFVTDSTGRTWYIDDISRGKLLNDIQQGRIDSISYYGDTLRIYENGSTTPFEVAISTVLEVSNDSINIQGGSAVKLGINELVTDSLANDSITFDLESRYQKIFTTDMTSAIDPVTVLLTNPIAAGVYNFEFTDITGSIDIVWPSNVKDLNRVSLGTYTYSGPFIQTLYYDGTNYIAIPQPEPAIAFENDSVTTTTLTIDLEFKRQKIVEIDMASVATSVTLTVNNPFFGSNESGVYTFHFMGVSGTDSVIWPAAFVDSNYTALGTDALTTGTIYTCYYNPNSLKYICK